MNDWAIDPLAPHHDRSGFDCGKPALSDWLRRQAGQFERRDLARVYVATRSVSPRVAGYYALSNCQVAFDDFPPAEFRKSPRMPLPAALIGKLATDLSARGQGLGSILLMSALRRIQHLADQAGACAVIVDAIDDDARGFYLHFGFGALVNIPRRLFLPLHQVRKLGLPPLI
jgi:GNAT superfamily N-acetyltransferase